MRADELSLVVRRSIRISKDSCGRRIIRLVPVLYRRITRRIASLVERAHSSIYKKQRTLLSGRSMLSWNFIDFPLQVNYVKTIDKYLIGCFLFVFATLAEYSLVLFLAARMKRYQESDVYKKETQYKKTDLATYSVKPEINGNGVVSKVRIIILFFILVFTQCSHK